ncbi:MAG: insulinase family protein [Phycisphaerae bacterium]|nr:insulinase family protein [Phycisphaerae bacterium]
MSERYFQHTFENGLTLLAEQMPGMQSAAMAILLPAGASSDPNDRCGSSTVLCDLVLRGAGERDNRQLTDALDSLGLQRGNSVGVYHTRFSCAAPAARVMDGLPLYADIVRRPRMPADGFESARDLALQALAGIDDEPRQKVLIKLREWHLPSPLGRNSMGSKEHLEKLTIGAMKLDFDHRYHAQDAIIAFAGKIEFGQVQRAVQKHFGDWKTGATGDLKLMPPPGRRFFEEQPSEQTHIGIAWESVEETHPEYYIMRLATEVLSGGMSCRLFTEVREKRGLCYSVGASYSSVRGIGSIFGYAGTSNDRAQATLDTFIAEVRRMRDGVTAEELQRARIGVKAGLIMSGESTSSRAGSIAHDFFMRGRIRTVDEISAALDAVTLDQVNDYLKANKPGPFTIGIVGPKDLKLPS